jgi:hypothetical protein
VKVLDFGLAKALGPEGGDATRQPELADTHDRRDRSSA